MLPSFEVFLTQVFTSYCVFLLNKEKNNFFTLFYLFSWIFLCGLILNYVGVELAAGFLWATEILVIFVTLLLLMYVSNINESPDSKHNDDTFFVNLISAFLLFLPISSSDLEDNVELFLTDFIWVDFYEAIWYLILNDFLGFFISFYKVNYFVIFVIIFILYLASIVCVILFYFFKKKKTDNILAFFQFFHFFKFFEISLFFRKQDLFAQDMCFVTLKEIFRKND